MILWSVAGLATFTANAQSGGASGGGSAGGAAGAAGAGAAGGAAAGAGAAQTAPGAARAGGAGTSQAGLGGATGNGAIGGATGSGALGGATGRGAVGGTTGSGNLGGATGRVQPAGQPPTTAGTANGTSVNTAGQNNVGALTPPNTGPNSASALTGQELQREQQLMRSQALQQQQNQGLGQQNYIGPNNRPLPPGWISQDAARQGLINQGIIADPYAFWGPGTTFPGVATPVAPSTLDPQTGLPSATGLPGQVGVAPTAPAVAGTGALPSTGAALPGANNAGRTVGVQPRTATTPAATANQVRGDRAYTVGDQKLLVRIREDVLPIVGGSATGTAPIRFVTRHGVVTLTGNLPSDEMRQRVIARIQEMDGVRNVVDQIEVGNDTALGGADSTGETQLNDSRRDSNDAAPAQRARSATTAPAAPRSR